MPTYICAERRDRKYVLENLDKLVVKAANESGGYGMLVGPHSTRSSARSSPRRSRPIRATTSRSPRWRSRACRRWWTTISKAGTSICGPYILYGKDIFVLPGGLTRVALKKGSLVVNSSQGGGSKDTWVLAGDPNPGTRPFDAPRAGCGQRRAKSPMLSRVADSIYWMSRYVERAENVARFIDVNLNLMLDLPVGSAQQWQPLVDTTGDHVDFEKRYGAATQQNVIQFLTFDRREPQLDPLLPARRARERPLRCAKSSRRRCGCS